MLGSIIDSKVTQTLQSLISEDVLNKLEPLETSIWSASDVFHALSDPCSTGTLSDAKTEKLNQMSRCAKLLDQAGANMYGAYCALTNSGELTLNSDPEQASSVSAHLLYATECLERCLTNITEFVEYVEEEGIMPPMSMSEETGRLRGAIQAMQSAEVKVYVLVGIISTLNSF